MYASPSRPPWVFTGNRPPISMLPSAMKSAASPGPQNPMASSCRNTTGLKFSYSIAASMSLGVSPDIA
jgi:hypothetical protein